MDSTNTLAQLETGQSQNIVTANELFAATSPSMAYAYDAVYSDGLVFAHLGARLDASTLIAAGTHTCGASTDVYMVVARATGVVSFSTSSTNWDDHTTYGQAYLISAGMSWLTYVDCRGGRYGILSGGATGVGDALTANPLSQFAATTSAQLRSVLSDETGTGAAVFADSPALAGNPTAPTQPEGNNSTRLATTAYTDAAIAALIGTAPGVLDTLGEISDAINDDANLYTTLATLIAAKAGTSQVDQWSVFIGTPTDKSYKIIVNLKFAATINEVTTISASGTCTLTTKINTTALGGTANSVSSSETTQTHSSANSAAAGDDIVLTVSTNSSCADMSVNIKYTRALA